MDIRKSDVEIKTGEEQKGGEGWARLRAAWILDRWKKQGFDTIACAPSGYCSPMNSSVMRLKLPESYRFAAIDSEDALVLVEESVKGGTAYRF